MIETTHPNSRVPYLSNAVVSKEPSCGPCEGGVEVYSALSLAGRKLHISVIIAAVFKVTLLLITVRRLWTRCKV